MTVTVNPGPDESRPARRGWRRRAFWFGLFAAVALAVAHRPLLLAYGRLFRVNDYAPSDALVIWSDRPEAVKFYRDGLAPVVLIIAASYPFPDLNPSTLERELLVRRGVPAEAIRAIPSPQILPDQQHAAPLIASYARAQGYKRVTVVTPYEETARHRRAFVRAFRGTGIDVRMAGVPNPWFGEDEWYKCDEGLVAYFGETMSWLTDW